MRYKVEGIEKMFITDKETNEEKNLTFLHLTRKKKEVEGVAVVRCFIKDSLIPEDLAVGDIYSMDLKFNKDTNKYSVSDIEIDEE